MNDHDRKKGSQQEGKKATMHDWENVAFAAQHSERPNRKTLVSRRSDIFPFDHSAACGTQSTES
jgi:hypothetical protein